MPYFAGEDGVAMAIQSVRYAWGSGNYYAYSTGNALAFFYGPSGYNTSVGTVRIQGLAMSQQSNNTYELKPTEDNPDLLTFSNTIKWEVAGGDGIPHFIESISAQFPGISPIADSTVNMNFPFTLKTYQPVTQADSVIFAVYGQEGKIIVPRPGSESSYTFTANEVAKMGKGKAILQVSAYRSFKRTYSGKDIYFVNQVVTTAGADIE